MTSLFLLAAILGQASPPPSDTEREARRVALVMQRLDDTLAGRPAQPLRAELWDGVSAWGLDVKVGDASYRGAVGSSLRIPLPRVRFSSPMQVVVIPAQAQASRPRILVRVCRGAECIERTWPWEPTSSGGAIVRGTVGDLVGDVGVGVVVEVEVESQQFALALAPS